MLWKWMKWNNENNEEEINETKKMKWKINERKNELFWNLLMKII